MDWHLLVVDLQEGFAPHIHQWESIRSRSEIMLQAAHALEIPVTVTEQNPAKLGSTVREVAAVLGEAPVYPKMTFSSLRVPEVRSRVIAREPVNLLLLGIEAHVCVLQTALDAISLGRVVTPYLLVDAISSRRPVDRDTAFRRLERAGAILSTTESVLFEFLAEAGTEQFRRILPLVR